MNQRHTAGRRFAVIVHLLCNNEHGLPSGHLPMMQLGKDSSVQLEAMWWDDELRDWIGPRFELRLNWHGRYPLVSWAAAPCLGSIRIGRRPFRIIRHRHHVGHMCWDAVAMPLREFVRMVRWLRRMGLYQCTEAPEEWWDLWHSRREIKPKHAFEL